METEKIDQQSGIKEGDCWGTWNARSSDCTGKCAVRERCRKHTLASGRPAPAAPVVKKQVEEPVMDLKDMDPMEYLVSALKGKFDSELANAETFDTWKFRDGEGRGVARVMVSKVSKQVRIQTANYTFLLKEGLVSVRQAHDLFNALMA